MKSILTLLITLSIAVYAHGQSGKIIPLEQLARLPGFEDPMVSPDGRRVAATISLNGEPLLVVQKMFTEDDQTKEKLVPIRGGDYFFNWYQWANDDRLILSIRASTKFQGSLWNLTRLVSVSRLGEPMRMFKMSPNDWGYYRQKAEVVNWLKHDPEHVLAALDDHAGGWASPEVDLVNVNTGKSRRILRNRRGVHDWIADSQGVIRIGVKYDTGRGRRATIYYRDTAEANWETLQRVDYYDHDRLIPYRFDEKDPNVLLVSSDNLEEEDAGGKDIFRYDLTARKVVGPFENTYRKKVLAIARKALPDMKVRIVSRDRSKKIYMIRAYSDIIPPEYYRLDLNRAALEYLSSEYPDLRDAEFSPMESISYKARDGLKIPAYLTVPLGLEKKNLPLVVYPHGGPWSRDRWGWDNYVQFMANRGYAVFQPQFRGSTGFGIKHEEAGYGQWGYAIQDDITDGVEWLVGKGIADPDRICIVGASFGGYAAAMGLAKTPDLYQCAVSINGVLNLKEFIDSGRQLLFKTINRAIWNERKDAKGASPYHMAKNIKAPLLLIGGERDTVVPVRHSRKMYKRLKRLKKSVEYIELEDGEHWRTNEAHQITVFTALERFLASHIGDKPESERHRIN